MGLASVAPVYPPLSNHCERAGRPPQFLALFRYLRVNPS